MSSGRPKVVRYWHMRGPGGRQGQGAPRDRRRPVGAAARGRRADADVPARPDAAPPAGRRARGGAAGARLRRPARPGGGAQGLEGARRAPPHLPDGPQAGGEARGGARARRGSALGVEPVPAVHAVVPAARQGARPGDHRGPRARRVRAGGRARGVGDGGGRGRPRRALHARGAADPADRVADRSRACRSAATGRWRSRRRRAGGSTCCGGTIRKATYIPPPTGPRPPQSDFAI